ncbi:DNA sulfur modification protein DndB [Streptomyces sp. Wb2n-11]|uniref:DNA sulfur modification protein DndB n=1 Tax=Streptomyces sp. Wb2n-11 TaxID=1030533 RepID=UPI00159EE6D5|nr:DNA sulfur modification protein DndB [Streptomyces sp. Wb2n-11]
MIVRPGVAVTTVELFSLVQTVPDPRKEEGKKNLAQAGALLKAHAEIRLLVQRTLAGAKGKNANEYADYIAAGLRGDLLNGWSTPPVTIWIPSQTDGKPTATATEVAEAAGSGLYEVFIPVGAHEVPIDGETQCTALHQIVSDPESYGLTIEQLRNVRVPVELYWDLSVEQARQVFHDRNVKGITVDKNLAMSMDQRDLGTQLAHKIADRVKIPTADGIVSLSSLVQSQRRQLAASDDKLITLSGLRALVTTALLGRSGIAKTSATVTESTLNTETVSAEEQKERVVSLLSEVLTKLAPELAKGPKGTALNAPAILTGLGVAVHHATEWADSDQITAEALMDMVTSVKWDRSAQYWDGVGGKALVNEGQVTGVSFAGGAKDSGGRVAEAILYPSTELGRKIRGIVA